MTKTTFGFIDAALAVLFFATLMLVVIPSAQLANLQPAKGLAPYSDIARRGREVYIENGCVYCHSQQPSSHFPDEQRGWGRPSTPADYVYDYPHLLGTMRTGPDLFNIGERQPSQEWHLAHLYQPRAVSPGSIMPAYPYLFTHVEAYDEGVDVVVKLPEPYAPAHGAIVANADALALVAYLQALDHSYPPTTEDAP